jgi:hypothetical protein
VQQVTKSMREGSRAADQHDVWEGINLQASSMDVASPTHAISDVYAQYKRPIDGYVQAFSASDDQVGALFAVGSRIYGFDLFDSSRTLRTYLGKLVRSYVLDALSMDGSVDEPPSVEEAKRLLEVAGHAAVDEYPALGLGTDVRMRAAGVFGAGLFWEDRMIHLNAFTDKTARRPHRSPPEERPWVQGIE